MEETERVLRKPVDAALQIARWDSTTNQQILWMLEGTSEAKLEQRYLCRNPECRDVTKDDLNRNRRLRGLAAQEEGL